ncbi:MAG: hypothetical protein AB9872_13335 [Solidesulfovibrio sp.]
MFLDGQLRTLETNKARLALRGELTRHLMRLELGLARASVRRRLSELAMGISLAERIFGFLRGR